MSSNDDNTVDAVRTAEVLLVEDDPADIALTRKAFERSRLESRLHVVRSGDAALDFLFQRNGYEEAPRPDLVLLDINLPRLGGLKVLELVKSNLDLCAIPVVMLTGVKGAAEVQACYGAHANAYITKPPSLGELVQILSSLEQFWFAVVTRSPANVSTSFGGDSK